MDIARQEVSFVFKDFVFIDANGQVMDNSDTRTFATENAPKILSGGFSGNTNSWTSGSGTGVG